MRTPSWDRAVFDAHRICAAVRRRECRAYQFTDGFDNETSAAIYEATAGGTITYGTSYARFSPPSGLPGLGVRVQNAWLQKNMQSNQATFIIKLALNISAIGGGGIIGALDSGNFQWMLAYQPSGELQLLRGQTGTVQASTGPGAVTANLYTAIEIEVTVGSSTGAVNIWVNGTPVLSATGLNTQATSNATANQVRIGDCDMNGMIILLDDFRVWDGSGSAQNAPLGTDSRIVTKLPSSAGLLTGWTPNGAAANWQCVDDNPPDGDTTYVSSTAVNNQDSYQMPTAGLTQAPVMVVARSYIRRDDAGPHTAAVGVQQGSSGALGPTITIGSTYQFIDGCILVDPSTGLAFTAGGADTLEHLKEMLS
jgi:hypothetical protein